MEVNAMREVVTVMNPCNITPRTRKAHGTEVKMDSPSSASPTSFIILLDFELCDLESELNEDEADEPRL